MVAALVCDGDASIGAEPSAWVRLYPGTSIVVAVAVAVAVAVNDFGGWTLEVGDWRFRFRLRLR